MEKYIDFGPEGLYNLAGQVYNLTAIQRISRTTPLYYVDLILHNGRRFRFNSYREDSLKTLVRDIVEFLLDPEQTYIKPLYPYIKLEKF